MASLMRTRCFLLLAAFLPVAPTVAEVVDSVSDCSEFLLQETPPQIPGVLERGIIQNRTRYKPICQTFKNTRRFLTVYDTENKIPVFSAYKFKKIRFRGRSKPRWMMEPQLEDKNSSSTRGSRNMIQATYDDFINVTAYDKGYLYPKSHAPETDDTISASTLTNIVPQAVMFHSWQRMERCVKCVMEKFCINSRGVPEGFVVTGAQASLDRKLKDKVNIPSMLWSAFCCYSSRKRKWLAAAHWGDNTDEDLGKYLHTETVEDLNDRLSSEDSRFDVFPGAKSCLNATAAEFYPEVDRRCQCPPAPIPETTAKTITSVTSQIWRMFQASFECHSERAQKCAKQCKKRFKICRKHNDSCMRRVVYMCARRCRCEKKPWVCIHGSAAFRRHKLHHITTG